MSNVLFFSFILSHSFFLLKAKSSLDQYVLHFSKMSALEHGVPKHTDDRDISKQYAVSFGSFTGASLVCYDKKDNVVGSFPQPGAVVELSGRRGHEVVKENFEGVRLTAILFQAWHELKSVPDPILEQPGYCFPCC